MKLGFIGTGIISSSLVTGFCTAGIPDLHIWVSPRNRERAAALQKAFPDIVTVAKDNQEVVDSADWIFAALLPQAAEGILSELTWPKDKKFINLVMTLSTVRAREIVGDREIIADVVPLTFAANRFGPSVIYPDIPEVCELMSYVGEAVPVKTAEQMAILRAMTGMMSPYYMLLTKLIDWSVENGLDEPSARRYITSFTASLSRKAAVFDGPLENLAREATPGGINWQALTHLEETDSYRPWTEILDPILKRVTKE